MRTTLDPERLEQRRDEIRTELASLGDLRQGSLTARYRKCGKPNCHCAAEEKGHGPSWSLTWQVGGKTATRIIPPNAVAQTQEQIAEYRHLRQLIRELVEVSDGICDAKLASTAPSDEAVKKGASRRRSTRKSSLRSPSL